MTEASRRMCAQMVPVWCAECFGMKTLSSTLSPHSSDSLKFLGQVLLRSPFIRLGSRLLALYYCWRVVESDSDTGLSLGLWSQEGKLIDSAVFVLRGRGPPRVCTWGEGIPQDAAYLLVQTRTLGFALVLDLGLDEGWETRRNERALLIFITL